VRKVEVGREKWVVGREMDVEAGKRMLKGVVETDVGTKRGKWM
jgi:hypothetical protein